MPNLKDIRTRIDSTKNTQQITRAMKMVSAAKLRRAQQNIVNLRPYANTIFSIISDIAATHKVQHPLMTSTNEVKNVLLVVLTSDRGLCAGFNSGICKATELYYRANKDKYKIDFLFVGRKGSDFFKRRGVKPVDTILNLVKDVSYTMAANVSARLIEVYRTGEYDEVQVIYNEFKSAIQQTVTTETLLPIDINKTGTLNSGEGGFPADMIFEPAPEEIIEQLILKHFNVQVYRCMSESVAAEHGARMTAMENATKNAGEMIKTLTLNYNKARQAAITTELTEICSGAEALKG